jgi:hypothetical protein
MVILIGICLDLVIFDGIYLDLTGIYWFLMGFTGIFLELFEGDHPFLNMVIIFTRVFDMVSWWWYI